MSGFWDIGIWDSDFWDTVGGPYIVTVSNSLNFDSAITFKRVLKGVKVPLNLSPNIAKTIKHYQFHTITINETPDVKKMNGPYFYVTTSDNTDYTEQVNPVWTEV